MNMALKAEKKVLQGVLPVKSDLNTACGTALVQAHTLAIASAAPSWTTFVRSVYVLWMPSAACQPHCWLVSTKMGRGNTQGQPLNTCAYTRSKHASSPACSSNSLHATQQPGLCPALLAEHQMKERQAKSHVTCFLQTCFITEAHPVCMRHHDTSDHTYLIAVYPSYTYLIALLNILQWL